MLRFHIRPDANHGVGVAFTDRLGGVTPGAMGSLNLGRSDDDDPDRVLTNHRRLAEALGLGPVMVSHQVHGDRVWTVGPSDVEGWTPRRILGDRVPGQDPLPIADAIVTDLPGVACAIRVADCLPVVLADVERHVVASAHAGRAGLLGGVLPATVARMRELGATTILGWVGPHICGRCYEVPEEMARQVWADHPATETTTRWGTPGLDLGAEALAQLADLGVEAVGLDPCTLEDEDLFSHRRDPNSGRMVGLVWTT